MHDHPRDPNIVKGQMPTPKVMDVLGVGRKVGIEAFSIDGDIKTFIHSGSDNLRADLRTQRGREFAAWTIAAYKLLV